MWMLPRATIIPRSRSTTKLKGSTPGVSVAERIFDLAGREFDIGKPSVLAKVCAAKLQQREGLMIVGAAVDMWHTRQSCSSIILILRWTFLRTAVNQVGCNAGRPFLQYCRVLCGAQVQQKVSIRWSGLWPVRMVAASNSDVACRWRPSITRALRGGQRQEHQDASRACGTSHVCVKETTGQLCIPSHLQYPPPYTVPAYSHRRCVHHVHSAIVVYKVHTCQVLLSPFDA